MSEKDVTEGTPRAVLELLDIADRYPDVDPSGPVLLVVDLAAALRAADRVAAKRLTELQAAKEREKELEAALERVDYFISDLPPAARSRTIISQALTRIHEPSNEEG